MRRVLAIKPLEFLALEQAFEDLDFSQLNDINMEGTLLVCTLGHRDIIPQVVLDWLDTRGVTSYVMTREEWDSQKEGLGFGVL